MRAYVGFSRNWNLEFDVCSDFIRIEHLQKSNSAYSVPRSKPPLRRQTSQIAHASGSLALVADFEAICIERHWCILLILDLPSVIENEEHDAAPLHV